MFVILNTITQKYVFNGASFTNKIDLAYKFESRQEAQSYIRGRFGKWLAWEVIDLDNASQNRKINEK